MIDETNRCGVQLCRYAWLQCASVVLFTVDQRFMRSFNMQAWSAMRVQVQLRAEKSVGASIGRCSL
jgi:hypothetical protein